ncbi:MAG: glycosyl hydrolase family 28-related protein [Candidatus Hydrogenedentota bacterium]
MRFAKECVRGALCLSLLAGLMAMQAAAGNEADGTFDIRDYGAVGDGETNDTEAFEQALEEIGEEPATLVLIRGRFVTNDMVFPENVTLAFRNGAQLVAEKGSRIEVNGEVDAGIVPIFAGGGVVEGAPNNVHVFPQWFGARGDGEHNDAPAIQQAADLAANATGRTLFVPEGEYVFDSDIELRCNLENHGLFVKDMEIDEERTQFSHDLFLPTHHPKQNPHIVFEPDHSAQELEMEHFYGIEEGGLEIPIYRDVPLANGEGEIDLKEGGTLRFYSSDFFKSRRVRKGARYYDKNDISQIVSGRGDVFPEFAFSYDSPPEAGAWSADEVYDKVDYVTHEGEVFKATWPSGEGSSFEHSTYGEVDIGPVEPDPGSATTQYEFEYEDGTEDDINIWRRVETQVWYREKDVPLTVNNLRVEVRLRDHGGETKRINAGAVTVNRGNMTFNGLEISVRDREATMSRLLNAREAVNLEFNNGYFSGATSAHLGYNILNSNVANVRYNDCISTNSRKGLDGRHGKNITIQGGYYNVIEDHYGRNYTIRDVTVNGLSVRVPGDSTPDADLQAWEFAPRRPFGLSGANLHIENCTVDRAQGGILGARGDTADLYGTIILRDITVRRNQGDVTVFQHWVDQDFDYGYDVRVPDKLLVEDIHLENPGRLRFNLGRHGGEVFEGGSYGPAIIRNTGPIGQLQAASETIDVSGCAFQDASFDLAEGSILNVRNSTFAGENTGLGEEQVGVAMGNVKERGAEAPFPIEYVNSERYETSSGGE